MATEFVCAGVVLHISGRLLISESADLRQALRQCVSEQARIELDLSGLEACDAAALQLLLSAEKTAAALGKPFRVVDPSTAVVQSLEALGLRFASAE